MTGYKRKAATRKAGRKVYRKRRAAKRADGGKVAFLRNTLVPDRMIMKMSYKDNINMSSATWPWVVWNGRANSIYDPDYAIVNGHQPLGFDQWSTFYQKFRVFKVFAQVTIINNTNAGVQCGLLPYNADLGNISTIDDSHFEQPHVVTKTVGGQSGINKIVLKKMIDIPRILGRSHAQYKAADSTASLFTTNPSDVCNLAVFARTINESSNPTIQAILNLTYYVELFDRKQVTISYPTGKNPAAGGAGDYNPSLDD